VYTVYGLLKAQFPSFFARPMWRVIADRVLHNYATDLWLYYLMSSRRWTSWNKNFMLFFIKLYQHFGLFCRSSYEFQTRNYVSCFGHINII